MNTEELNKLKSDAVMEFVNSMIGAYESGFIEVHESNLADVYMCAKQHVNMNYKTDVKSLDEEWGKCIADMCMKGDIK